MPIPFKSLLSSIIANNTFLDKTVDDVKKGVLGLYKTSPAESGAINDAQDYMNEIADTTGQVFEGDPNRKVYSSNNYISDGDNRKVAIGKLDAQALVSTNAIADINQILSEGEYIIKAYANDAAYEAENGSPPYTDLTGIYYNTTTGLLRYYDGVAASWNDVGKTAVGEHEDLGNGDGVTVDFDLTFAPLTEDSFIVFLNGTKVPRSDYTFSNPTITFNNAPALGQKVDVWNLTEGNPSVIVTPSGTLEIQYYTLTASDITNKNITLVSTPSTVTKVVLDIVGSTSQHYGVDYSVSGTTLSWNGLGLDGIVNEGDVFRYWYFTA